MGKSQFSKGMEVEICSDDQGLRGVWFAAKILQAVPRKKKIFIEYHTLMADEEGSKPLREFVDAANLRPIPPRETEFRFQLSDEVDAYHSDGWWEGIVTGVREENSRYLVYFRTGKEELEFGQSELRIHREWVKGQWVPPMEDKAKELEEGKEDVEIQRNADEKADGNIGQNAVEEKEEGRADVTLFENADHLQKQEKLSIDEEHDQTGVRSDQTEMSLVSNIDEIARTVGSPVHEGTLSVDRGLCFDSVTSRCQSSSLEFMSTSTLTADMANESDTLEEAIGQPNPEKNDSEISSPCETLKEIEMTEASLVLVAQVEEVTPSIPAPEGEEASLQNKKEITKNMFNTISNPSEELNNHLAPNFIQGEIGNLTDRGVSGSPPRNTLLPVNNEGPSDSSETQEQCLENNHNDQHLPCNIEIPNQQQCLEAGWLCPETGANGKEDAEKPSSLPEPKVDKEKRKKRPSQSQPLSKKRPSQQCPKLTEPFIPSDEEQQCRRTGKGWRCSAMAFPHKRYCEKHDMEQNIRNQKRRKRPIEQTCVTMEPFQPSDPHQCRRSGKGWRCRAMAPPGKRYCDKHQLEQNIHNEKRRKGGKTCLLPSEDHQQCGEMDIDGGQPDPLQVDETCLGIESNQADTANVSLIGNGVKCSVNMQCDVGKSDQAHTEPIQEEAAEAHVSQVDISDESERKKRMTGAFFDEFWPVFIT